MTEDDIAAWFASREEAPSTQAANLGRLSALFSYAKRRRWILVNPCDHVERVTVEQKPPRILTPDECRRILTAAGPALRPWLVLGLFVGLRPAEAERLEWTDIRLNGDTSCVVVAAAASKVRRRRVIPMMPTARAWLALDAATDGRVVSSHSTLRRARREASQKAGVPWSQDVLRHTHASMRIAAGADPFRLATEMGNSPRILLSHYVELATAGDAADFWGILPPQTGHR